MDYSLLPEYVRKNAADYKVTSTKGYRYLMKNNVKSKSEYDGLLKSGWTVESESWSEWSDWTTSLDGTSDMIIEQNSKDAEPVEVPFYQYSHYKYYDEASKSYQYSATELEGVECTYESIESPDKLTIAAFVDGVSTYTLNGQTWFNQESIMKSVIPSDKLYQYRYKTIVMTKMSGWVEKLPDGAKAVEEGEVFCYVEPERYIIEIRSADGATLYKNLEIANKTIAIDESVLEREGFIITGLVDEDGNAWNLNKDAVTENTVLTVNYKPVTYTVTFKDSDGTVVKECTVDCYMNAVPPVMESDDENVFVGWDSEKFLSVTEDLVVSAKYIPADEMPTLKSARDSYYMYPGNTRMLSALTSNIDKDTETIIWTSMNPKIATVTDDGRLEAVSEGETDIVISELSSGLMAICTVNVAADPSSVIDDNPPTTTTENDPSSTTTTTTVTPDPNTTDTHIASDEDLCEWAENDYQNKNGLTFTNSFVKETGDGDYQIMITDKSGKILDTYTIDPETGKGVNSEGEEVDLPQTGNNSLRKLLIIISSLMLIGFGMIAMYASGIIRRKKNEEQ